MATYPTVAELRTEFLKRKRDIADVDSIAGTFLQWCNYVNRFAYKELSNIMPEQYIESEIFSTVAGVSSYDLPVTFQDIIPQGTGIYEISESGIDTDRRSAITGYGSTKNGFYLTPTSLVFTPAPVSARQFRLRFIPLLDELSAEDNTLIIPTRFSQHIMDALDACYNLWDEDTGMEVFNDDRFIRTMNELVALINPIGQSYGLPDFSSEYYY